jgi:hypothetical protein
MARVKRGTQAGDDAILKAVSGCEDIRKCGLHIAGRETPLPEVCEDRYTVPSVYDGTDLKELIREEREMQRKTVNKYIYDYSWTRPLNGNIRIYTTQWSVVIVEEGGSTYKIGGANLQFNEPIEDNTFEIKGDLMVERNGRIGGFALIGAHGTFVRRIKSDKPVWCAKVVPIAQAPKVVKL